MIPDARLDDLLDTAPCGFLTFSDDGAVRLVNSTLLEMLGYARDELLGSPVERIMTVGTRIFHQTHFFPLVRLHGHAEEIFLQLRGKSGETVGVLANAVRRERAGAQVTDCVFMRVREREKYEAELLRAKKVAEEARAAEAAQRAELERANERLEAQAVDLEAQHRQLQDQAMELEVASEELHVINDALLERTEELEHERAVAEEANRAKSTFLAVMSHELRTPLNAIGGYTQLLEMGIHGPVTDAQREALRRIERSQRHLLRLINDVLNLSRIEAGRVEYAIEDIALPEIVADVAAVVDPLLAEKGLAFEIDVAPGLVARADREKVHQVLVNLLANAVKFTPAGGRVAVRAARPPGILRVVAVEVSDTGIGIPADKLDAVFQPFVQVDTSRTRTAEGTGLGLAISRDLARGMGGDLTARSELGAGSTFTLTLPAG